MRERSVSEASMRSSRSRNSQIEKKEKAYLMKKTTKEGINSAKRIANNRIKERSNTVRGEMSKVYRIEGDR
jgi:hypothetical protein